MPEDAERDRLAANALAAANAAAEAAKSAGSAEERAEQASELARLIADETKREEQVCDTRRVIMGILPKKPTRKGLPDNFTGDVWIDDIAAGEESSRLHVSRVRFAPGARTAWHYHSCGQTLHVIDGIGLVSNGNEVLEIRPGDTIYTPRRAWHWHGAAPEHFMAHFSFVNAPAEGAEPVWGNHVTDNEYGQT